MVDIGYLRNEYDNYVYHKRLYDDSYLYLLLYVDDMLIICKYSFKINKVKA